MIVLAIDTSHPVGTVALATGGDDVESLRFGGAGSHLVELGQCVDRLLGGKKIGAESVGRIALTVGPGSFTGLRIGLAFVKGWYAGLGTEVVVKNTLEMLALPFLGRCPVVCPMIDARKGEVYAAVYRGAVARGRARRGRRNGGLRRGARRTSGAGTGRTSDEVAALTPAFVGSGVDRYKELFAGRAGMKLIAEGDEALPSTDYLCRIAPHLNPLTDEEVRSLEPFYLRPSGAKLKKLKPINPHA